MFLRFTKCQTEKFRHNREERLLEALLEKINGQCKATQKPSCICMLTHKWELACNFFVRATVLCVLWLTEERVLHAIWPEWCCWRMNCRICANHPDSGWLAAKSTWIALELISWRHNGKDQLKYLWKIKMLYACRTTRKPNCICILTHKSEAVCNFFARS